MLNTIANGRFKPQWKRNSKKAKKLLQYAKRWSVKKSVGNKYFDLNGEPS